MFDIAAIAANGVNLRREDFIGIDLGFMA